MSTLQQVIKIEFLFQLSYFTIFLETPMVSICANSDNEVWSCSKNGSIFRRLGGTCDKPEGEAWLKVDGNGIIFKQVSIGKGGCWAIDQFGKLYNRREITTVYPEGIISYHISIAF